MPGQKITLALLTIMLLGFQGPAPALTGYEYSPMIDGETRQYKIYEVTGAVVSVSSGAVLNTIPDSVYDYRIDLYNWTPHANSPQSGLFSHDVGCETFGSQKYFATYNTTCAVCGEPSNSPAIWSGFGYGWDGERVTPYLGEVRNQHGNFILPPEPQLPLFPRVGQILDTHSSVYESCDDPSVAISDYHTSLYVLAHLPSWKRWSDVWITVLTERTGQIYIYEYVWARGIGVVDAWYGRYQNGTLTGYEQILIDQ